MEMGDSGMHGHQPDSSPPQLGREQQPYNLGCDSHSSGADPMKAAAGVVAHQQASRVTTAFIPNSEHSDLVKEGRRVISAFLQKTSCYEIMKTSGKVVVFDVQIPMKLAYFALVEHDIKSAPLWSTDRGQFVGLVTATDFINFLLCFRDRSSPLTAMSEYTIATWRDTARLTPGMISISPEQSLYEACRILRDQKIHRLPVVDPQQNSVLTVLTHLAILEYLVTTFREQRRLFDQPIRALGIGTFREVITVSTSTPLIDVLSVISTKKVSAVPIVDEHGVVVDIYSSTDVTSLARDETMSLSTPVSEVLKRQHTEGIASESLQICSDTDTLHQMFEKFASFRAHRLVCVDGNRKPLGIISLSDLFNYFVD